MAEGRGSARLTKTRWFPAVVGLTTLVLVGAIVEFLLRTGVMNRYVLPLPSEVLMALSRVVLEENILVRTRDTAFEVLSAGFLVVLVGVPIGALFHRSRLIRLALEDWMGALAAAPIVLAFPLFLVLFGRGPKTVIIIAFVYGVAPIVLKTLEGLSATRPVLTTTMRSASLMVLRRCAITSVVRPRHARSSACCQGVVRTVIGGTLTHRDASYTD